MKLGKYQHYKTKNYYRVIGIAKHSETLEETIVYEALYDNPDGKLWVRPKKMFLEKVTVNGEKIPRFRYIGEFIYFYMIKRDANLFCTGWGQVVTDQIWG